MILRHPESLVNQDFRDFFAPERSPICGFLLRIIRHDRLRGRHLGAEIEVGVDVAHRGNVAVSEPFLNIPEPNAVCIKQSRAGMTQIVEADTPHPVIFKKRRERLRQIAGLHTVAHRIDVDIILVIVVVVGNALSFYLQNVYNQPLYFSIGT